MDETPVAISERPWPDPWDGLLSGTYRFRVIGQRPETPDHLVVYIRGAGGDPTREYRASTTICGITLFAATRPDRVTEACVTCLAQAGHAFTAARTELASRATVGLGE